MKPLGRLAPVADPAWPELRAAIDAAKAPVTLLHNDRAAGEQTLWRLQVTAASTLGALALNCGGLLVDHGWLRILGGGTAQLPDLASANGIGEDGAPTRTGELVVAMDVLGGRFCVNGGTLPFGSLDVGYWGPDTLEWMSLELGHTAFVHWALDGGCTDFYRGLRWPGWEREVEKVAPDMGIVAVPFPFTEQGRDLSACRREAVPMGELLALYPELARQLADHEPGTEFEFKLTT